MNVPQNPLRTAGTMPDRPSGRFGRLGGLVGAAALVGVATWMWTPSCSRQAPDAPPVASQHPAAGDTLLTVDDLTVTFGDVAAAVAWYDRLLPEYSERKKIEKALQDFTLPLLFARREFAARRQEVLALARTARAACGNVAELEVYAGRQPGARRTKVTPGDVAIPMAEFLFDPLHQGAVSDPLELPHGYALVGSFALEQARTPLRDQCDALQVVFPLMPANEWAIWLENLHTRLADRVTYVHPDYRLAIPAWMKLP